MNWIIALSIALRLLGVGYSVLLLARTRDRRFGFLTLLLSFMTLRQLLTVRTANTGLEELPGLVVSGLTLLTVYYLSEYVDEEDAVKTRLQTVNERLRSFRKAIEHAGHAIFLTDPDGTIEYANPAVESVTGYEPEEVLGENPRLWQSGKHDEAFYAELWEQIESGAVWEGELTNRRKSGELCWIDATIAPITENGDVERYVAIERDVTERKEREMRIEGQNERLTLLNNTNEVLRDINRELVAASTREEIESAVCEQFASSDLFDAAWIGSRGLVDATVSPRSWAGTDVDSVDGHVEALCAGDRTPVERALEGDGPVFTDSGEDVSETPDGERSVVVPLAYRGAEYGVLVVVTDNPNAFDQVECGIFAELGRTVADAISAVESKRTLASDSVTELEFQLAGIDEPVANMAARLDCTVTVEHVGATGDSDHVQYVTVGDGEPDAVTEYAAEADHIDAARHLYTHGDRALFRLSVDGQSIVATLAQYGAGVESLSVSGTSGRLVAHVASSNDIRTVVDALRATYDDLTLVAQRECERDVQTEAGFRKQLSGMLTDRQREAARTAYFAGFFDWPREHSGEEVASMMDISQTTFTQHLRAAEKKLFSALFEETVANQLE
ncbi:bacterio-opsin activator domain-containing protein [Halobellus limi]|jgi:PAS domain S-box-containing protein|uniref:PAS domain S-box protein n=1 Tax=Halobellus limi TaxID=699433 RepID=A0A1H6BH23_9EURY|nr:bacterio-opsin activator domain-containing protein [Halobellus limi]QCC49316.1 PAS domain S-box protein [Halobellus limi]SEG59924.1 PAS domain S-box-containing protein [Halobellus limi]